MALTPKEKKLRAEQRRQKKWEEKHKIIDGLLYKWCSHGQHWVVEDDEHWYKNDKNGIDGYYPNCISCEIQRTKIWRQQNPEKYKALNHYFNTNPSDKTRESNRKNTQNRRKNGKYYVWLASNPEKTKQYALKHRVHDISDKEWIANKNFFKNENGEWCCAYCGITEKKHKQIYKQQLHKDHVDNEGYNDVRNCVPACKDCNSSKWAFPLEEWYKEQDFFNEDKLNKIKVWCNEEYKKYIEEKPPCIIIRKQNEDRRTYHFEIWSIDEKRNIIECIGKADKKKELNLNLIRDL